MGGTIQAILNPLATIEPGDVFPVMMFASHSGDINTVVTDSPLEPGLWFEHQYSMAGTALELVAVSLPADFNLDGYVDGDDLAIWETGYGLGNTFRDGDADGNGKVDGLDYLIWQRYFGTSIPAPVVSANVAVPEPATCTLLLAAAGCLTTVRKKQSTAQS